MRTRWTVHTWFAPRRQLMGAGVVGAPAQEQPAPLPLPYCRAVYSSLVDWYKVADAKGQVLLSLDGIFITVLAGAILLAPKDLIERKLALGWPTWTLLALTATSTVSSVICAIMCLHSRLSNAHVERHRDSFLIPVPPAAYRPGDPPLYRPAVTFWFGTIASIRPDVGLAMLRSADPPFELDALSEEIILLAPNVLAKHRWVNRGWIASGCALILLLLSAASVVIET